MSISDSKAQSLANLQPSPVPAPPSYLATLALTPEELLEHALQDVVQHSQPDQSPFYIPLDQRQNVGPKVLLQQLIDTWENLPIYDPTAMNAGNTTSADALLEAFFQVIVNGHQELVERFLTSGLLDANTPRISVEKGLTPLLCAIQQKRYNIAVLLLSHGARVNEFGVCRPISIENSEMREPGEAEHYIQEAAVRTPLQLAAQLGDLELVKLLIEEHHADDAIVAPDGQLALRLAKGNGHKAVVSYLPARRGGGYRRWKTKHHKFMKRIRKSVDVLTEVGVIVVWKIPKWTFKCFADTIKESVTYLWKNKHKFPAWCREVLKGVWQLILDTPQNIRKLLIDCWKCSVHVVTKTIPHALELLWKFLKNMVQEIANALVWIINRLASFLHTVYHAIVSAFKLLTWTNIRAGFVELVRAIFISIPRAIYRAVKKTIPATWKGLVGMVKCFVWTIYFIGLLTLKAIEFVTVHLWKIISAMGGSTATAGKEVYVWFNPKG